MESVRSLKQTLQVLSSSYQRLPLLLEEDEESFCNRCFNNMILSFPNADAIKVTHFISDTQVKQLFSTFPMMKRLTLNTINLSDDPFLDISFHHLSKLEKLHLMVDRCSYYDGHDADDENIVTKITIDILWNWPFMSRLKKLKLHFRITEIEGDSCVSPFLSSALCSMVEKLPNIRYFSHDIKIGNDTKPGGDLYLLLLEIHKHWPKIIHLGLNIDEFWFYYTPFSPSFHFKHLKFLHLKVCADSINFNLSWLSVEEQTLVEIFEDSKRLQYIHGAKETYRRSGRLKVVPYPTLYREMVQNHATFTKLRRKLKIIHKWLSVLHLEDTGNMELNIEKIRLRRLEKLPTELDCTLREEFRDQPYTQEE